MSKKSTLKEAVVNMSKKNLQQEPITRLVQVDVDHPSEAVNALQDKVEFSVDSVPLIAVPSSSPCCFTVPSGYYTIMTSCGKDTNPDGLAAAGFHCVCCWERVSHVVTAQSVSFNAPVKSCPTADNVMVDCDLLLVFRIKPQPDEIKKFVYGIGAVRFGEYLAAVCEEGIRGIVRDITHEQVNDLRGAAHAKKMTDDLNDKFARFGVEIKSVVITDVRFNGDLAQTLQATTEFASKMIEEQRSQDLAMKNISNSENKKKEEMQQKAERALEEIRAQQQRAVTEGKRSEVEALAKAQVASTQSEQKISVMKQRAVAERNIATTQGNREKEDILAKAKSASQTARIKVDEEAHLMIYESEQRLIEKQSLAAAIKAEAEAEKAAALSLRAKRAYQLKMAENEILSILASRSKIVISGDQGDKLINRLLDLA